MKFSNKYTTNEKITTEENDKQKDPKDKIEKTKTILSNDAYAVGEGVDELKNHLISTLRSFAK